jgi:hypothetical protein
MTTRIRDTDFEPTLRAAAQQDTTVAGARA